MAKKLLELMLDALRLKHYSYPTEEAYPDWARRYILYPHCPGTPWPQRREDDDDLYPRPQSRRPRRPLSA